MFCKVELYIVRWDLSWPERLFLHFFRKLFRTRLCKDIIYTFAQKRSFLQRRKSVCKRSCTVRGMRPPQGPACVRLRLGIFAKIIEKQQKNLSFVKDLNSNKAFCVFQVCAKHFHCRSNPYRNLSFLYYFCCFCMNPIRYPYTSGSLRRPHPTYGTVPFGHTFLTLQKNTLLSAKALEIHTRAGPKTIRKKCKKMRNGPRRGVSPGRPGAQNR